VSNPFIIGLCGGSASGKTYLLKALRQRFTEQELALLSMDDYYRPKSEQPLDNANIENFDLPESIDLPRLLTDLNKFKDGHHLSIPSYTFNNPTAESQLLHIPYAPVILIEGIFVLHMEALRAQLNLSLYIEAAQHIRYARRLRRDLLERGYDMEDVLYRMEKHVAPSDKLYIEPYRHRADLIIPNNGTPDRAVEVLSGYIKGKI
jgi:uridine kinase